MNLKKYIKSILFIILFFYVVYPKLKNKLLYKNLNYSSDVTTLSHRNKLLKVISNFTSQEVKKVNTIILIGNIRFGNALIGLSNTIFFCIILLCKEIIIPNTFLFIKNPIYYKKFNVKLYLNNGKKKCNEFGVICIKIKTLYYFDFGIIEPKERFFVFKDDILKNIHNFDLNANYLYIHVRRGDIFEYSYPIKEYPQPPLCFYDSIINNFSFRKIFILSENKKNPVIDALLTKYNNVYYLHSNLQQDISYIMNAYNLVSSCSSFIVGLIRLSNKLKTLITMISFLNLIDIIGLLTIIKFLIQDLLI